MINFGQNDRISNMELWTLMFVYVLGSLLTLPVGYAAGHDSWISAIIGTIAGIGINWIYAFLCAKYPQKSLVEIAHLLMGTWIGKAVGIMYFWYSFYLGAYVLRSFTDMTGAVLLPKTPTIIVGAIMIAVVAWTAFKGIEVISRCSLILFLFVVISTLMGSFLLIPDMELNNLFPILESGWSPILKGAGQIASVPLGETIVFAMLIPYVNRTAAVKKTVVSVIGVAGAMLVFTHFVNIFVLGEIASKQLFPSYTSVMYIAVADFFERIEPLVFTVWVFNEFTKLSVCLLVSALALSQTIGSRNFRFYLVPIGLLMLLLSLFLHPDQLNLMSFLKNVWPLYSIPFIIVIPLTLLALSMLKRKPVNRLN
ncbi:GerAB/ArcD/ProY family transporter [Cohnella lupini]|uniref:Spore germination protein KB n=1 Tax=Cohnella lupini TaxID=1294267 RepID=A0A3D9ICL7_9BACL|nr:endospore germination permease [Cohnella lupini]RED59289.1 spore germination protein KB [Cohnella lupini]